MAVLVVAVCSSSATDYRFAGRGVLVPADGDVTIAVYHDLLESLDYSRIPEIADLAVYEDFPRSIVPRPVYLTDYQLRWKDDPRWELVLDGKYRHVSVSNGGICAVRLDGTPACWLMLESSGEDEGTLASEFVSGIGQVARSGEQYSEIHLTTIPANYLRDYRSVLACGLSVSGVVRCWGSNDYGHIDVPEGRYLQIEVASTYACGLTLEREAVCWGAVEGNFSEGYGFPREVKTYREDADDLSLGDSDDLSLGDFVSLDVGPPICGLNADSSLVCWSKDYWYWDSPFDHFDISEWSIDTGWSWGSDGHSLFTPHNRYKSGIIDINRRDLSYGVDGGVYYRDVQAGDGPDFCGLEHAGAVSCLNERFVWRDLSSAYASYGGRSGYVEDRLLGREDFEYLAWLGRREGPYREAVLTELPLCGVLAGGGVECWGGSRNGVAIVPEGRFAAVSLSFGWGSGRATACGVRVDLSVVCWGWMPPAWRVDPPEGIRVLSIDEEWDK